MNVARTKRDTIGLLPVYEAFHSLLVCDVRRRGAMALTCKPNMATGRERSVSDAAFLNVAPFTSKQFLKKH